MLTKNSFLSLSLSRAVAEFSELMPLSRGNSAGRSSD